jgi:hypothetical protein
MASSRLSYECISCALSNIVATIFNDYRNQKEPGVAFRFDKATISENLII